MNSFKRFMVNVLACSHWIPLKIRLKVYNLMGINISSTEIRPGCFFNSEFVKIGSNCFINYFSQFHSGYDEKGLISIGEKCFIGMNVNLCTVSHRIGDCSQRAGTSIHKPIVVGSGTWIGANSIILPGVNIGDGCIVAAGSVVNKDCEANYLYAGNPAKKIKKLPVSDEETNGLRVL